MPVRSGGFRASSFRSSSFRSFSSPKPSITPKPSLKVEPKVAPVPKAQPTKNITVNKTIIQKDNGGFFGGDGPGFFTGMFMGHMMSDNNPAPVIVNNPGTTTAGTVAPAPAYVPQEEEGMGFFGWSVTLLALGLVIWIFIKKFNQ